MSMLTGTSTADIAAPLDEVWKIVEDVEIAPQWQGGLNSLQALERDDEGRGTRCEVGADIKVRTVKTIVRFTYAGPTKLSWSQEKGDLKAVDGSWVLEDLGDGHTRATYTVDVDLGRVLGMLVKGPLVGSLRQMLAGARAGELKARVEQGA
ncbi:MAG TPA: SRPBCC family protein [Solirubrobacteraceae bacterium]|jgi:carbon monoxide dehydrogenase subunit G|nr:SRPBCC family protein [Solirubrobacteraceae bacterium]